MGVVRREGTPGEEADSGPEGVGYHVMGVTTRDVEKTRECVVLEGRSREIPTGQVCENYPGKRRPGETRW